MTTVQDCIETEEIVSFTQELIRVPSLSGQEGDVAKLLADRMRLLGFDEVLVDAKCNVVGRIKGYSSRPTLLFNGHIDHVPPGEMSDPYSAQVVDGERFGVRGPAIYGRGACDMKGAVAAMVYAAAAIRKANVRLRGDIVLALNAFEEGGTGEHINYIFDQDAVNADMAINGEATNLNVHLGHRGTSRIEITVKGLACHSANPDKGINALSKATELVNFVQDNYEPESDWLLGKGTFTPIDISASPGGLTAIVPETCRVLFDRRFLPDRTPRIIEDEVAELIAKAQGRIHGLNATARVVTFCPPMRCRKEEPIVQALLAARQQILGDPGAISAWTFSTDAGFIAQRGIPCVGFGPGSESFAHTQEEHVAVDHLEKATRVYADTMCRICM